MRTSAKQVLDFCAPHRERDQGNTWSQNLLNCESRKKEKVGAFRSARKSRTLPFSAFFMAEQRISRELFHHGRDGDVDGKAPEARTYRRALKHRLEEEGGRFGCRMQPTEKRVCGRQ